MDDDDDDDSHLVAMDASSHLVPFLDLSLSLSNYTVAVASPNRHQHRHQRLHRMALVGWLPRTWP